VYVNSKGERKVLTNEEFERFQKRFLDLKGYFKNPEEMEKTKAYISKVKDQWTKVAKKIMTQLWR